MPNSLVRSSPLAWALTLALPVALLALALASWADVDAGDGAASYRAAAPIHARTHDLTRTK